MNLDSDRTRIENRTCNGAYANRIGAKLYIGDCIRELTDELKQINKNLEKIANNTEKDNIKPMQDIKNIGEFYGPIKRELDLNTITCNKNKDSYVDKNIISD